MWHPWRALRHLSEVRLEWQDVDHEMGHYDFAEDCITITVGMTQAERRSTLTHELIHRERGPVPSHLLEKEEGIVRDLTARRLIPMHALVEAMLWSINEYEIADEVWADVAVVRDRLTGLSEAERDELDATLRRRYEIFADGS